MSLSSDSENSSLGEPSTAATTEKEPRTKTMTTVKSNKPTKRCVPVIRDKQFITNEDIPPPKVKRSLRPRLFEASQSSSFINIDAGFHSTGPEHGPKTQTKNDHEIADSSKDEICDKDGIKTFRTIGTQTMLRPKAEAATQCEGVKKHYKRKITEVTRKKMVDDEEVSEREFYEDSWEENYTSEGL